MLLFHLYQYCSLSNRHVADWGGQNFRVIVTVKQCCARYYLEGLYLEDTR